MNQEKVNSIIISTNSKSHSETSKIKDTNHLLKKKNSYHDLGFFSA